MAEVNSGAVPNSESKRTYEKERVNTLFLNKFRGDAVIVPIKIISTEINMAYRKHFDGVSRSLFYVRYYSRVLNNEAIEDEILKGINGLFDQAAGKLDDINKLADVLINQHAVKIKNGAAQTTIDASVIDPLANHYLKLIAAADEVARKYSALWVALAINDKQKKQALKDTVNILREVHRNSTRISLGLRDRVSPKQNSKPDEAVGNATALREGDEFGVDVEIETEEAGA